MIVYTSTEARRHLAAVLDQACKDGAVQIRRRDGTTYTIRPAQPAGSPLDVGFIDVAMTRKEIVAAVQESRERGDE